MFLSSKAGSETYPSSHSIGNGMVSMDVQRPEREADHLFLLAPKLRTTGNMPPMPTYAVIACTEKMSSLLEDYNNKL
jgi:hypothetical protein